MHYSGGVEVLSSKVFFSPKFVFQQQGPFTAYTGGMILYWIASRYSSSKNRMQYGFKPFYGGVHYPDGKRYGRANNTNTRSLIFIIGHQGIIEEKEINYQVGLSYDQTLNLRTAGAFELSFNIFLPPPKDSPNLCPFQGNAMGVF